MTIIIVCVSEKMYSSIVRICV